MVVESSELKLTREVMVVSRVEIIWVSLHYKKKSYVNNRLNHEKRKASWTEHHFITMGSGSGLVSKPAGRSVEGAKVVFFRYTCDPMLE